MNRKLLRNATVLAWDDDTQSITTLHNHSIVIEGDTITAINPSSSEEDTKHHAHTTETIDVSAHILTPGLINTHIHTWQTAFRTLAPNVFIAQYFPWLSQMGSATRSFSAEDVYLSCLAAYAEGLNAGVTGFVDHASVNWKGEGIMTAGWEAARDGGGRVWWCYDVESMKGDVGKQEGWLRGLSGEEGGAGYGGLVQMGIAFDGYDLDKEESRERLRQLAKGIDAKVLTTHYLGGPWPVGRTSPSAALSTPHSLHETTPAIIFSHGGFATPADISALHSADAFLAITPENETCEGHGQPTTANSTTHPKLASQCCLGTDTNWNISGDLLAQARLWLSTLRSKAYEKTLVGEGLIPRGNPVGVSEAFNLVTRQGGLALKRGQDLGVLKVGAKADIVCWSVEAPNMWGCKTDAVAAVLMHANVGDVKGVLVGGKWRKRDGVLVWPGAGQRRQRRTGGEGGQLGYDKVKSWEELRVRFEKVAERVQRENSQPPEIGEKFLGMCEMGDVESFSTRRE